MEKRVKIIGAGIAGIAAAIRMSRLGFDVEVFEKEAVPGGKMGEHRWEGYRWDTGPSLFTLPEEVEELFRICGDNMRDHIPYTRLERVTRYFYEDGKIIDSWGDPERFIQEAEKKTGIPAGRIRRYLRKKAEIYDLTAPVFIYSAFKQPAVWFSRAFIRAFLHVRKLEPLQTMHRSNEKWFASPHLVQLFDRYATYNGSDPMKAPATLSMIAHLEHALGAYYPEGGMYRIANELYRLALRQGVRFRFSSPVEKIIRKGRKVEALVAGGEVHPADLLISDMDVYFFYKRLLPEFTFPHKWFSQPRSSSALIFYWAMDRVFPELDLHNIFFSATYKEEFAAIFDHRQFFPDPTVYLYISSRLTEGDAPAGKENWFVMINVPENNGTDLAVYTTKARDAILDKLERILGKEIRRHILYEHTRNPQDLEEITGAWKGSLYGNSSNSRTAAFKRHPNSLRSIGNLYFAGGSVHPGGGIPLCLASARIVEQLVRKKEGI